LAHGSHLALADASFTCEPGTTVAVVGPNGSGKSTLLSAVGGLQPVASGVITVLGSAPAEVRSRVSYVLQAHAVNEHLPATVAEVVTMGRYAQRGAFGPLRDRDRKAVTVALERMDIGALRRRHLTELSGGQRQRVFVAQGLAQEADLLLLDEPVTGLDLVSRELILEAVATEVAAGRTVLLTTHDLSEAQAADQVLLLAGRVVASGPPDAVLTGANLQVAYGGRVIRLDGHTALVDDPHHHAEGDDHTGHLHPD
jgi:manganese transport system ATP-binding protein